MPISLSNEGVGEGVGVARSTNRLTALQAEKLKVEGRYVDGDGLILQVGKTGAKSWILKYRFGGKIKELGLGSYRDVKLAAARDSARDARALIKAGRDPILEKRIAQIQVPVARGVPTFGAFGLSMIQKWQSGWKNPKHVAQWEKSIRDYAKPLFDLPLDRIETAHVLEVLSPIWSKLPETGRRVRGRIERILDAAAVMKLREGANPARWQGHLEILLPASQMLSRGHHAAAPYASMPKLITQIRALSSTSALALEFLILTAARTGEVIYARRSEIDFDTNVWTVPKARMKSGREHRVPLSPRAVEILRHVWPTSDKDDAYIFRGNGKAGCLSNMAMTMCLRGQFAAKYTVHGFRSAFRDWTGDETDFAREIAEAALAHVIGDKAEQAYRRGDALERRRKLMEAWADYLVGVEEANGEQD